MKRKILFLIFLLYLYFTYAQQNIYYYDFSESELPENVILKNFQGPIGPRHANGYVNLVSAHWAKNVNNAIIFPDILADNTETEHITFYFCISRGAHGAGLALINTEFITDDSLSYKAESWERPNFKGSFGLGIDIYNPQSSHWFDEFGNYYGREEREISLHWDNKEMFKMLSPIEFRSVDMDYKLKKFDIILQYVTAGALVNVAINDTTIIDKYFIPEMTQYSKQPVFGGSTGELTVDMFFKDLKIVTEGVAPKFSLIHSMNLLTDEIFHAESRRVERNVTFANVIKNTDRVIMTLDLGGPEGGVSDWDVTGAVYLIGSDNIRYEILRYITPYRRPYVWKVDVTDFLPLFTGKKTIIGRVDTWEGVTEDPALQKGWKVTATLDFYKGPMPHKPFEVHNLWAGSFEYGDPDNPMKDMLDDFEIKIPKNAKTGKLRITTTGHGMSPNSENAAEFRPSKRTVIINGVEYTNLLWKTDCYLNPCRPQDGTWKFDRAGWAPGDVVLPWEIDLTEFIKTGKTLKLSYIPDDYVNENKGDHWAPHHFIEAQIIFY